MNGVSIEDARCLIAWPDGTRGYIEEYAAIIALIAMCNRAGYGRIPQLAADIEALWREPSLKADFEERRQKFLATMEEAKQEMEGNAKC